VISTVVMAHPQRRHMVTELTGFLDRPTHIVWDEHDDVIDTGRRCLQAHDPKASHHLIIQDDAVPCADLFAGVEKLISQRPETFVQPLSLYVGKVRPHTAQAVRNMTMARRERRSLMAMAGPLWGVCLVIPTDHLPALIGFYDRQGLRGYDSRIGAYYKGRQCLYTVPSLVEHRSVTENPSLFPGRGGNRQAWWFHGRDRSALDIEWTEPWARVIDRHIVTFVQRRTRQTRRVAVGSPLYRRLVKASEWEQA